MWGLEWWWGLLLLPAPLLVGRLSDGDSKNRQALAVPILNTRAYQQVSAAVSGNRSSAVLWIFWICLVLAACRPFWLGDPISRTVSGRDLMLAVDVSGSMSETDMTIASRPASRIDVLKLVVGKFIERREGDRIGLILFGTNAYTYVPLTFDLDALGKLLDDVSTGLAGRHTAIGDALGLAVKSLRKQDSRHKVLILVTDGSNTAGFENPVIAARSAADQGMTIHTVGIGSDAESLARFYGAQNIPTGLVLNEELLAAVAAVSGGQYFRATNLAALERIYFEIDKLEPVDYEYQSHRPRHELYQYPLFAGLLLMLLRLASGLRKSRARAVL